MRISKEPAIRRQEIIDTACALFAAQGTARTAMSEIAERAGIAKGLVYYYFASREALLAAVVNQLAEGVDQELAVCIASNELDFPGKLTAFLQVFFGVISRHPHLLDPAKSEPVVRSLAFDRLLGIAIKHGTTVLAQGARNGLVQLAYPEAMLKILVNGLGGLYVDGCTDPQVHATITEQVLCLPRGSLCFGMPPDDAWAAAGTADEGTAGTADEGTAGTADEDAAVSRKCPSARGS